MLFQQKRRGKAAREAATIGDKVAEVA